MPHVPIVFQCFVPYAIMLRIRIRTDPHLLVGSRSGSGIFWEPFRIWIPDPDPRLKNCH
jgi:hypothetical protein